MKIFKFLKREIRFHCFEFIFMESKHGQIIHASNYVGYPNKNITLQMIEANKKAAGVGEDALLLDVLYFGYMTREVFTSKPGTWKIPKETYVKFSRQKIADILWHEKHEETFGERMFRLWMFDNGRGPMGYDYEVKRLTKKGFTKNEISEIRSFAIKAHRMAYKKIKRTFDIDDRYDIEFCNENFSGYSVWINWGEEAEKAYKKYSKRVFIYLMKKSKYEITR